MISPSPYGRRGELPCTFTFREVNTKRARQLAAALEIPGVRPITRRGSVIGVRCGWDAQAEVARILHVRRKAYPRVDWNELLVGRSEAKRIGLISASRGYQRVMAKQLAARDGYIDGHPMRVGKSFDVILAGTLRGCERWLLIVPGYARATWSREIAKWLKPSPKTVLILYGRGADKARWVGERKYLREKTEIHEALRSARFVICNFACLITQVESNARGEVRQREDLPGWGLELRKYTFDVCVLDEPHDMGGTKATQYQRALKITSDPERIPIVWALSGTPGSEPRTFWSVLSLVFPREFGSNMFAFQVRYCGGRHVPHKYAPSGQVWVADRTTNVGEFRRRLQRVSLVRSRSELGHEMPRKTREIVHVDVPEGRSHAHVVKVAKTGPTRTRIMRQLKRILSVTGPACADEVGRCLRAGHKSIVYVDVHESRETMRKHLERQVAKIPRARLWDMSGRQSDEQREVACEQFRAWDGPAVFLATITAFKGAKSLRGAEFVEFLELNDRVYANFQAEERPFEPGTSGLHVRVWCVRGSYTDRKWSNLRPQLEAMDQILGDGNAQDVLQLLKHEDTEIDNDAILDRMVAEAGDVSTWDIE